MKFSVCACHLLQEGNLFNCKNGDVQLNSKHKIEGKKEKKNVSNKMNK